MKFLKPFCLFSLIGALGLGVDLAVLLAMAPHSNWYLARVLSFWIAATFTWALNRTLTFRASVSNVSSDPSGHSIALEYLRYLKTMVFGGVINYAIYALTLGVWQLPHAAIAGVIFGSAAGLLLNFHAARTKVFH